MEAHRPSSRSYLKGSEMRLLATEAICEVPETAEDGLSTGTGDARTSRVSPPRCHGRGGEGLSSSPSGLRGVFLLSVEP